MINLLGARRFSRRPVWLPWPRAAGRGAGGEGNAGAISNTRSGFNRRHVVLTDVPCVGNQRRDDEGLLPDDAVAATVRPGACGPVAAMSTECVIRMRAVSLMVLLAATKRGRMNTNTPTRSS